MFQSSTKLDVISQFAANPDAAEVEPFAAANFKKRVPAAPLDAMQDEMSSKVLPKVREGLAKLQIPDKLKTRCEELEHGFCSAVVAAFHAWAADPRTVVLWDCNLTLGARSELDKNSPWGLRPSVPALIEYLNDAFPLRQGILTSWHVDVLRKMAEPGGALHALRDVLDSRFIFSSLKVPDTEKLEAAFPGLTLEYPIDPWKPHDIQREVHMLGIAGAIYKLPFRLIDDGTVAVDLGEHALCIQKWNCSYVGQVFEGS